jgi:hypothetical protein
VRRRLTPFLGLKALFLFGPAPRDTKYRQKDVLNRSDRVHAIATLFFDLWYPRVSMMDEGGIDSVKKRHNLYTSRVQSQQVGKMMESS